MPKYQLPAQSSRHLVADPDTLLGPAIVSNEQKVIVDATFLSIDTCQHCPSGAYLSQFSDAE